MLAKKNQIKKIVLNTLLLLTHFFSSAQSSPQIDSLFRNSYTVFELQRLPNGMYRDSKILSGTDYHPISIANTGMGLISLCIADSMGWITDAEQLVLTTLKSVTGHTPGFTPDRTSNGYYRHFMDINTGAQEWGSEYSTIDTDILVSGALFCMTYFEDASIAQYAMELWNSINFEAAIANTTTGQIYLSMNSDGSGVSSSLTSPYSEYMIVAWLAKNYSINANDPGNVLWNNHYNSVDSLQSITYSGYPVLSDNGGSFLSSFAHQFNYYLCHHFTTSNEYLTYFDNSQKADEAWWATVASTPYEWGLGAGSAITNSYHSDAINNNNDQIVSPHIIAGYIPINPSGKTDLISLWDNDLGKYILPTAGINPILWRYSLSNPIWIPNEIIGIDHSTMLFGLSTLPEYLGNTFFSTYNDFFPFSSLNVTNHATLNDVKVFPNPVSDQFTLTISAPLPGNSINILSVVNSLGQKVFTAKITSNSTLVNTEFFEAGLYSYIVIIDQNTVFRGKLVVKN